MTKLMIATPAQNGLVDIEFCHSFAQTIHSLVTQGISTVVHLKRSGSLIISERNSIMSEFMKSDCSHLLCIDADIAWIPSDVFNLLAKNKEIIGAAYLSKGDRGFIIRCINDAMEVSPDGLIEVAAIPMGFVLIHRSAIEKMQAYFPDLYYKTLDTGEEGYGFFNTMVRNKEFWGEDFSFFLRARDAGLQVWIDPSIELNHAGKIGKFLDALLPQKFERIE